MSSQRLNESDSIRVRELIEANDFWRSHASALDKNWSAMHSLAMDTVRSALDMPDASVSEMCERIRRLRDIAEQAKELVETFG